MGSRVPPADSVLTRLTAYVIGNKADAAVTTAGTTKSIVAYLKGIISLISTTLQGLIGAVNDTTTDSLHGKIGTDTEMADLSLFDFLLPVTATGDADFDISEADYTAFQTLLTITPATGKPLLELVVELDYNKATTGWDTDATAADTLDVAIVSKLDGTNWRGILNGTQITANGDGSLENSEDGERFWIGPVAVAGEIKVMVKVSAERGDAVIPYRVTYRGAAPTITPVAAA